MKIGFDARMINHSGIGVYIKSLLEELLPLSQEHSFTLFGPKSSLAPLSLPNKNVNVIHCELPIYSVQEQLFHPVLLQKLDLYHVPHYNIPLLYRGKMVVTLHDLNHLKMPQFLPSRLAYPYAQFMIRKARERSKRMICVSDATLKDLNDFLGCNGTPCHVVHEAAKPEFFIPRSSEELEGIRNRYQLPEHYILSVGILKPHKNLLTLIRVLRKMRKEGLTKHNLVIVGKSFKHHPEIISEIKSGKEQGFIRHFENIPFSDLPGIYQQADIFVFLSLLEGFGLPILEAFASGVPVLASNTSSLPEIAGDGALLVDPTDERKIKESLIRLLTDQNLRTQLVTKAKERLKSFSWKKAAEETLKIYEHGVRT